MGLEGKGKTICYLAALFLCFYMNSFFSKLIGADERVRSPGFAGSWYPEDAKQLDGDLTQYLAQAIDSDVQSQSKAVIPVKTNISKENIANNNILAVIAPHAGYAFSGKTAAFAYQSLTANKYKRVFLLGPSHHVAFKGIAFPEEDVLATPLGNLQVDQAARQRLLQQPYFHELSEVFDIEHSLEMQLPWIRKTLGNVKLVPLAVGIVNADEIDQISKSIKSELTDGDLIVISSDFTHYGPRFDYQPFGHNLPVKDLNVKIKELDMSALNCLKSVDSQTLLEFYERTHDTICGIFPCSILLSLLPSDTQVQLLNYRTSQDAQNDFDGNSVTYMAVAFSSINNPDWSAAKKELVGQNNQFSDADGKTLLKIARLALQDYLQGKKKDAIEYADLLSPAQKARFMEKRGVFVTLYKKEASITTVAKDHHKQLRGCIGYIYPSRPLFLAVCQNVINAASNDPRFDPVSPSELEQLTAEINLLTVPKPIDNWQDIKLGQDGIVLRKGGKQSVFLPKVPTEFGWDLEQTLSELSLKAGLSLYDWQDGAQFEVFQGQSFSE